MVETLTSPTEHVVVDSWLSLAAWASRILRELHFC